MCVHSGAFVRALAKDRSVWRQGLRSHLGCVAMAVTSQPGRPHEGGCDFQGTLRHLSKVTPRPVSELGPEPAARPGVGGAHVADWPTAGEGGG